MMIKDQEKICERNLFAAYVDGELDRDLTLLFEDHLDSCEECRAELRAQADAELTEGAVLVTAVVEEPGILGGDGHSDVATEQEMTTGQRVRLGLSRRMRRDGAGQAQCDQGGTAGQHDSTTRRGSEPDRTMSTCWDDYSGGTRRTRSSVPGESRVTATSG